MSYVAFEACQIPTGGDNKPHRGVRIRCGHCAFEDTMAVGTSKSRGNDDDVVERMIAHKFERVGWKIGRNPSQNRCPKCFTAIKLANKRKGEENMADKVVPILQSTTALASQTVDLPRGERAMNRDERRIIITKLQDIYLNETVGYMTDWTDDKVAEDMGVPRVWVSTIREETFGPDLNENTYKVKSEAQTLLAEMLAAQQQLRELMDRSASFIAMLNRVVK